MKETVKLRNGTEENFYYANGVLFWLTYLWDDKGVAGKQAVYELREFIRDSKYEISPPSLELLHKVELIKKDGSLKASGFSDTANLVKNVVLSALEGESYETTLVDPIAPPDSSAARAAYTSSTLTKR